MLGLGQPVIFEIGTAPDRTLLFRNTISLPESNSTVVWNPVQFFDCSFFIFIGSHNSVADQVRQPAFKEGFRFAYGGYDYPARSDGAVWNSNLPHICSDAHNKRAHVDDFSRHVVDHDFLARL